MQPKVRYYMSRISLHDDKVGHFRKINAKEAIRRIRMPDEKIALNHRVFTFEFPFRFVMYIITLYS